MKNLILILLLVYAFISKTLAYESGWIEQDNFMRENLVIPDLQSLSVDKESQVFYTYSSDKYIRYWSLETGKLTDSLQIDSTITKLYFSTDGKSAILMKKEKTAYYSFNLITLKEKKEFAKSSFKLDTLFSIKYRLENQEATKDSVVKLDYNFERNEFYISYYFNQEYLDLLSYRCESGYLGVLEIIKFQLKKKYQISNLDVMDYDIKNDSCIYVYHYACKDSTKWNTKNAVGFSALKENIYRDYYNLGSYPRIFFTYDPNMFCFSKNNIAYIFFSLKDSSNFTRNPRTCGILDRLNLKKNIMVSLCGTNVLNYTNIETFEYFKSETSPISVYDFQIIDENLRTLVWNKNGEIGILSIKYDDLTGKSGWWYKKEIMNIPSISALSIDNEEKTFYTYNNKQIIRKFSLISGKLIDTFKINFIPENLFFSSDSKTVICFNIMNSSIYIYDLNKKILLTKTYVDILRLFDFQSEPTYIRSWTASYNKFDYVMKRNELYISFSCDTYFSSTGKSDISQSTGFLGIMEIKDSLLIKKMQIINTRIHDYLLKNDSCLFTYYYWEMRTNYGSTNSQTNFGLDNYNLSSNLLTNYFNEKSPELIGKSYPTRLLQTNKPDVLLFKSGNTFYFYDIINKTLLKDISLESVGDIVKTTTDNEVLIQYKTNNYYYYLIKNQKYIGFETSPIETTNFEVVADNKGFLIWNKNGEIYFNDKSFNYIPDNQPLTNISISPNPANENVEFLLPEEISGTFEIFNQQSQRVFIQEDVSGKVNLNTQIFPTGIYFCVYKTKDKVISQKFMVVH